MAVTSELSTMVEADMAAVRTARQFVRSMLADHTTLEICNDLMLGTSELVTNAVEYGTGSAIQVTVRVADGRAAVTVTSAGGSDAIGSTTDWHVAGADARSGRGLGIVRAVSDEVSVNDSDGAVSITITRAITRAITEV